MEIPGIPEPKGNWHKPFLEIALRGIRKANFSFESWDIDQIPNNLEDNDFECLNNGWGVFKAPEEHTCAYITQEFASSPFTKGYWVAPNEKDEKEQRWYMIEREFHLGIKNIYPNTDFSIWKEKLKDDNKSTESEFKNQVFDNSTNSRWADILINRIGFTQKEFKIYIDWIPVLLEAKRITKIDSRINSKPQIGSLKNNYNEVLKDVRKLLGLKIGLNEKNTEFKHPHTKGKSEDFFPTILFWGLQNHCDYAIKELIEKEVSISYNNNEYIISNWAGLCKVYQHRIKDYENNNEKEGILKVVLLEFNYKKK